MSCTDLSHECELPHVDTGHPLIGDLCQLATEFQRLNRVVTDPECDHVDAIKTALAIQRRIIPFDNLAVVRQLPGGRTALQLEAIEDNIRYFGDQATMPRLPAGLVGKGILGHCPQAWLGGTLQNAQAGRLLPWLREMSCAFSVPIPSVRAEASTAFVFRRSLPMFSQHEKELLVIVLNLLSTLMQTINLRRSISRGYQVLDNEFKAVGDIQRQLLPAELPQAPGVSFAVDYQTSERAGGDYYDFFPEPDGRLGMFIGDVSGHGAPAAVVMAMARAVLHNYSGSLCPPDSLLTRLNQASCDQIPEHQFMTAFFACLDPRKRTLRYSTAGHPLPRLWRPRTQQLVSLKFAGGLPLGTHNNATYTSRCISLEPGDVLVSFTDGLVEVFNRDQEMFGTAGLDRSLVQSAPGTASQILQAILQAADQFTNLSPLQDDRTVVVVQLDF